MRTRTQLITIIILSFLLIPFIFWNLTFGFWAGPVLALLFIAGIYHAWKKGNLKPVFTAITTGIILYLVMLPVTTNQMNKTTADYQTRISSGEHLSCVEKWNIYGLNITMSAVAYPVFPEVAKEAFLMMFPTKDGIREFESNFFMKSRKLTEAFNESSSGRVVWSQKDYTGEYHEARAALALNICTYKIFRNEKDKTYKVSVPVRYPSRLRSTVLKYPVTINVEEGLFHYLEKEGWLFPYTAVWIHKVKT